MHDHRRRYGDHTEMLVRSYNPCEVLVQVVKLRGNGADAYRLLHHLNPWAEASSRHPFCRFTLTGVLRMDGNGNQSNTAYLPLIP